MSQYSIIYGGPGKVYYNPAIPARTPGNLFASGESGEVKMEVAQEAADASSAMYGRMTSFQGNAQVNIDLTPFDDWTLLAALFPAFLGVTVGGTIGVLKIGTQPHNPIVGGTPASDAPTTIWAPDGRLYTVARTAIIKPPDIHLGLDKNFFGPVQIVGLVKTGATLGTSYSLYQISEATYTAASSGYGSNGDPGEAVNYDIGNIPRGAWLGAFGSVAQLAVIEAEDEWTISSEIKYQALSAQKLVRCYILQSVKFMVKVRPVGPSHTVIDTQLNLNQASGRVLGSRFASGTAANLVLTNGSRTITLYNSDIVGAGYEFGGSKLGTGEVGFINGMTFTSGAPQPLLGFTGS